MRGCLTKTLFVRRHSGGGQRHALSFGTTLAVVALALIDASIAALSIDRVSIVLFSRINK